MDQETLVPRHIDDVEIQEWLESLDSVLETSGTDVAREILELHTLGVRSGYTQDDVIAFANVLTGWTYLSPVDNPEHGGEFTFNPRLHEPGAQKVIRKTYEQDDAELDVEHQQTQQTQHEHRHRLPGHT